MILVVAVWEKTGQADPLVLLSIQALYTKINKLVKFSRITRTLWKIASKFGYLCKHKEFEVDMEENAFPPSLCRVKLRRCFPVTVCYIKSLSAKTNFEVFLTSQ